MSRKLSELKDGRVRAHPLKQRITPQEFPSAAKLSVESCLLLENQDQEQLPSPEKGNTPIGEQAKSSHRAHRSA